MNRYRKYKYHMKVLYVLNIIHEKKFQQCNTVRLMSMDLNQALAFPISDNGNHRHMQSLVGMRSATLIPPEFCTAQWKN